MTALVLHDAMTIALHVLCVDPIAVRRKRRAGVSDGMRDKLLWPSELGAALARSKRKGIYQS